MGNDTDAGTEGDTDVGNDAGAPTGGGDAAVLTLLRALAEPNRLRLLRALQDRERCVRDLVDAEHLPQPLVSHHLAVLARAGLVGARRADGFTMYFLDRPGLDAAQASVVDLLDSRRLSPAAQPGGNPTCCRPAATRRGS